MRKSLCNKLLTTRIFVVNIAVMLEPSKVKSGKSETGEASIGRQRSRRSVSETLPDAPVWLPPETSNSRSRLVTLERSRSEMTKSFGKILRAIESLCRPRNSVAS